MPLVNKNISFSYPICDLNKSGLKVIVRIKACLTVVLFPWSVHSGAVCGGGALGCDGGRQGVPEGCQRGARGAPEGN